MLDAERRARSALAVGAVADRNLLRIGFRFEAEIAAMAAAVDFHCLAPFSRRSPRSLRCRVRQPEMMADLVHQHVGDDGAQAVLVLGPVVEDRAAIEPDHVGQRLQNTGRLKWQTNTLEQAEQVEFCLDVHVLKDFLGRKIGHLDDEIFAKVAEMLGQAGISVRRQRLDFGRARAPAPRARPKDRQIGLSYQRSRAGRRDNQAVDGGSRKSDRLPLCVAGRA